jgi:hypothetical protein
MKKNTFLILGLIIVLGLFWALYSNTTDNQGQKSDGLTDNSNNSQNSVDISIVQTEEGTATQETTSASSEKAVETANPVNTAPERKLSLFVDKNNNAIKDSTEALCTLCSGEQLLYGRASSGNNLPSISSIKITGIDLSGSVKESALGDAHIAWGAFDNKRFIVPPTEFVFGDGSTDEMIPAIEYQAKIAGVNANIIEVSDENNQTQYTFKVLIPMFQTALNENKTIYIKYSLNTDETRYYLTSGKITKVGSNYVLNATWEVDSSQKAGYENPANVSFYLQ